MTNYFGCYELSGTRPYLARARAYMKALVVVALIMIGAGQTTAYADTVVNNIAVGSIPVDVAVNPSGSLVYVSNTGSNTVSVINTSTNAVSTVSDPSGFLTGGGLQEIAVSPDNSRVYVAAFSLNYIAVINTSTQTVVRTINVGFGPIGVAFNAAGTKAYVTNSGSVTVSEITLNANIALDAVTNTISVSDTPRGVIAINTASGARVYVACAGGFSNNVTVIDPSTAPPSVITTITVSGGPFFLDAVSGGSKVYVSQFNTGQVAVISTSTNTVSSNVSSGGGLPMGVAVSATPTGNRVFVANFNINGFGSYDVGRINASTDTFLGVLTVQKKPRGVAANAAGTRVYVANTNSNTVSIIDTTI